MTPAHSRVEVMHGVNLDMLGQRDPDDVRLADAGSSWSRRSPASRGELELEVGFFQTNFEGEFVEHLHRLRGSSDGILLNPGAWTHYSWAIHDALEIAACRPSRCTCRRSTDARTGAGVSVIADLCLATISGQGVDGYREALVRLRRGIDG